MADLHKVMENQCQHLIMTQRNELLKLLQKSKELLDGTLVSWKISIRIRVKRGCEANLLATIPSTKGKQGNVQKGG